MFNIEKKNFDSSLHFQFLPVLKSPGALNLQNFNVSMWQVWWRSFCDDSRYIMKSIQQEPRDSFHKIFLRYSKMILSKSFEAAVSTFKNK